MEPIEVEEAKVYLKVDGDEEDSLIQSLIVTARRFCENYQRRAYITRELEYSFSNFPCTANNRIELPKPPLKSVESVTYKDFSGNVNTLIEDVNYIVDKDSLVGAIMPAYYGEAWPVFVPYPANAVKIRYTAGIGDSAQDVPEEVKLAMKMLIAYWYDNREAIGNASIGKEVEFSVKALLTADRIIIPIINSEVVL